VTRAVAIVDTNVVVAGILTANPESPVARVLDGMLRADFPFVVSEALLSEYRSVLLRPKLSKLHRLRPAEVDVILVELARHAIVSVPERASRAPDPANRCSGICSRPGRICFWSPETDPPACAVG
jgi:predicted nucleic acid-binding protein